MVINKIRGKKVKNIKMAAGLLTAAITFAALSTSPVKAAEAVEAPKVEEMVSLNVGAEELLSAADADIIVGVATPSPVEGYDLLGVVTAGDGYINIRSEANTEADIVGKISKDSACEILEDDGDWSHIVSGEIDGYISNEFLLKGSSANDRAEEVLEENGEVETAITLTEYKYGKGVTNVQMAVCDYALQYVGNPYVYGGTSLTRGADCSGFTMSVYSKYGVSLPHSSRAQVNSGERISLNEVMPGDLIFYGGKSIHHVALYIGNGQVVHAQSRRTGIVVTSMYYNTPSHAVRVIG